ncbi:MAG TPA: hypothetical protein VIK86_08130 [Candidatus Paceibacterota bacterium]
MDEQNVNAPVEVQVPTPIEIIAPTNQVTEVATPVEVVEANTPIETPIEQVAQATANVIEEAIPQVIDVLHQVAQGVTNATPTEIPVTQNRFKSWILWGSVFTLICLVLKYSLKIEIPYQDSAINLVLIAMSALGIINNPSDPNKV